ncbi:hypothetical protein ACFX1Q_044952 [Malus domestica]
MRHRTEEVEPADTRRRGKEEGSKGRTRRWREIGGGGWDGLRERSATREKTKARAGAAMNELAICWKLSASLTLCGLRLLESSIFISARSILIG